MSNVNSDNFGGDAPWRVHSGFGVFFIILAILAVIAAALLLGGCAPRLTPQTRQTIDAGHQQAAIAAATAEDAAAKTKADADAAIAKIKADAAAELAKQKAAYEAAAAKAKAQSAIAAEQPASHPMAALGNIIRQARPILFVAAFLLVLLWALAKWADIPFISSRLTPLFGHLAIIDIAVLFLSPWVPWGIPILFGMVTAMLVYRLVKDHGNIAQAIIDTETDLGVRVVAKAEVTAPATGK